MQTMMTATATAMPDWMHSCCARNAGGAVGDGGGCVVAVAARLCASGARSPCALSVPGEVGWNGWVDGWVVDNVIPNIY